MYNSFKTTPVLSDATFQIESAQGTFHRVRIFKRFGSFAIEPSFSGNGDLKDKQLFSITGSSIEDIISQVNNNTQHHIIGKA